MYNSQASPAASTKRRAATRGTTHASPGTPVHVKARSETRDARLKEFGYKDYSDYLRSSHWQATKDRYRRSQLPQECFCGETEIHFHHLTYENLGRERLSDLIPLCRNCHAMVHALERQGLIGLDLDGLVLDEERAAMGRAFLAQRVAELEQQRRQRIAEEQALVLTLSFPARLLRAKKTANTKRRDVSRHVHFIKMMAERGKSDRALTSRLRVIESIAYDWEDW